jgi:hypothetical protein
MDLLTIAAFFLGFSLLFAIFIRTRHNEKRLEKIFRELALKEKEEKR